MLATSLIRKHVEELYKEHKDKLRRRRRNGPPSASFPGSYPSESVAFTSLPIQKRQDIFRSLSRKFAMFPEASELHLTAYCAARVKASYAYIYDCEQQKGKPRRFTQFPRDVAFRDLCDIKAQAGREHKTVRRYFYDRMDLKRSKYVCVPWFSTSCPLTYTYTFSDSRTELGLVRGSLNKRVPKTMASADLSLVFLFYIFVTADPYHQSSSQYCYEMLARI